MSRQVSSELEADNLGEHHRDLLTEHDRLSLNAADTPSDDTETIDHGRVRVSADDGVGVEDTVLLKDNPGKPLKVHLVDDAVARRDNSEVSEGRLAPFEESEAFTVPVEFDLFIAVLGIFGPGDVNLDGVVDNEVSLAEWVDLIGITPELLHGCAHGSQIDDSGHTRKVLQEDSGWFEGNLEVLLRGLIPVKDGLDVSGCGA